jgi:hypothetical protein
VVDGKVQKETIDAAITSGELLVMLPGSDAPGKEPTEDDATALVEALDPRGRFPLKVELNPR